MLYDTQEKKRQQVTSGFFNDDLPVFDPEGKYLYYRSKRIFEPIYSESDNTWIYTNGESLVAVPLRKDVPSPLAPRDDEEPVKRISLPRRRRTTNRRRSQRRSRKRRSRKRAEEKKGEVALTEQKSAGDAAKTDGEEAGGQGGEARRRESRSRC